MRLVSGAGAAHTPECVDPERTSHCWFHGDEPLTDDTFQVCFECGHVYETPAELVAEWRRQSPRPTLREALHWPTADNAEWGFGPVEYVRAWWRRLTVRADRIFFCQVCVHDF